MKDRNIIVHVHIFKNAGSSFDDTLLTNFNNDFVDHREDNLIRNDKKFLQMYLTEHDKVKAFSSHSIYHRPESFDNVELHPIYFFRHPIERIKSVYSFEKKQPARDSLGATMAKKFNFEEYIAWRMQDDVPATVRNLQTMFLAGVGMSQKNMDDKFNQALENINNACIGVVDRYDESMVVFEEYFKPFFPDIDLSYVRRNVTNTDNQSSISTKVEKLLNQLDNNLADLVKENNKYDLALYEKANLLLDEKILQIKDFNERLEEFRQRCKIKENHEQNNTFATNIYLKNKKKLQKEKNLIFKFLGKIATKSSLTLQKVINRKDKLLYSIFNREILSTNKKKVFIQANCQGQSIIQIFSRVPRLKKVLDFYMIKPVHLWKDEDYDNIIAKCKECDVFIHQPVSKNFNQFASDELKKTLKPTTTAISFPVLYFKGYNPEIFYLKNETGKKIDMFSPYHDINILNCFIEGLSEEETYSLLTKQDFYTPQYIKEITDTSLNELSSRENSLSIRITTYLKENMNKRKLFHTMNHPSNEILFYVVDQILKSLKLEALNDQEKKLFPRELLGSTQLFLYPSVKRFFDIKNIDEEIIFYDNNIYDFKSVISKYYKVYKNNYELAKYNYDELNKK